MKGNQVAWFISLICKYFQADVVEISGKIILLLIFQRNLSSAVTVFENYINYTSFENIF